MQKYYYILLTFLIYSSVNAQIINFPDVNLKALLLSASANNGIARNSAMYFIKIDANNDGAIQQTEANEVTYLI